MDETFTTIYYDGQYWKAMSERCCGGRRFLAEYTFGPEPSAGRLLEFYLNELDGLRFTEVDGGLKISKKKLSRETSDRRISKSHIQFTDAQKAALKKERRKWRASAEADEKARYRAKQLKKKVHPPLGWRDKRSGAW